MKICFITPEGNLNDLAVMSDFHLIIANFVEEATTYTEFFRDRVEYVIMDNGLFETHVSMSAEEMAARACLVGADEVVAPDVLFDNDMTICMAEEFIDMVANEKFKIMAVPQGDTPEEWFQCLDTLCDMKGIDVIGLSILSVPHAFGKRTGLKPIMENRMLCTQMMEQRGVDTKVEYHLLGCGNPLELMFQKQFDWIRSCDTSSPVIHGLNDVLYHPYRGLMQPKIQTKLDFKSTVPKDKYPNIYHNMAILRKLAQE